MIISSLVLLHNSRKGGLELDQLGKLILGAIFLIILIYIVTVIIGGDLGDQQDEIKDVVGSIG